MKPNLIPVVYLVYREILSSVIPSQVLTPLEELRGVASVSLGLMTPPGILLRTKYRPALNMIASRCREKGIDVGWLPSPPTRFPWLWSDEFVLRQWISKRFQREQPFIVRCRSARMTAIAIRALRSFPQARVIYDCRGAEVSEAIQVQEMQETPESQWPKSARNAIESIREQERISVEESAGVTCVSNAMIHMLQNRYPKANITKFRLVPCCTRVDSFSQAILKRDDFRRELGLHNKFIVTYLGSLAWFHLPDQMMRLFRIIQTLVPNAHFLAITTDPVKMQCAVEQAGFGSGEVTIRSVPPLEVPRWLVTSDLGLCLLKNNERDRVCSPLKIAEYFSAGVPVVVTPQQGDYSDIVVARKIGVQIDVAHDDDLLRETLREFLNAIATNPIHLRHRCAQYAERELSWSGVIPRLVEWYRELLESPLTSPSILSSSNAVGTP